MLFSIGKGALFVSHFGKERQATLRGTQCVGKMFGRGRGCEGCGQGNIGLVCVALIPVQCGLEVRPRISSQ